MVLKCHSVIVVMPNSIHSRATEVPLSAILIVQLSYNARVHEAVRDSEQSATHWLTLMPKVAHSEDLQPPKCNQSMPIQN
jgi:hypothetical protein